jgi:hypothetical protein
MLTTYCRLCLKMALKLFLFLLIACCWQQSHSQRILISWGQQTIENYTKEMYDQGQKLTATELLSKNLADDSWANVFLTMNASANNYSKDTNYLKGLANQITNNKETKLAGTSRLVIWDRIITGDILFEGKGLVIDNDLFKVAGRANQLLQSLTKKDFGPVTIHTTDKDLEGLKNKWVDYLSNKAVEEYKPIVNEGAKIPEISSLTAFQAFIISLQDNPAKNQLTKNCLKKLYKLDELPKEKDSPAHFCNPDTYTLMYLGMLMGIEKNDETRDAKWWQDFWGKNKDKLVWSNDKKSYEVKK